ncbi:MAG: lysylphosphatidylglycerol synthase transmembrane domain-containing protein [Vicingaceae bacterium]
MTNNPKALKLFSPTRIAITIVIGLSVATYLVARNFKVEYFESINWTWYSTFWVFVAFLMMATRDIAYMYRIRVLTDNEISWRHSFDTIMLWEFASAISPSIVGGSGVAIYIVNKEGVKIGRSTAVVMTSALLDELFYILTVPVIILAVGYFEIFNIDLPSEALSGAIGEYGIQGVFLAGYLFIVLLTSIITFAVFWRPRGFKWILLQIFRLPFLRKWRHDASATGDDIMITSKELRGKPFSFWAKAFGATLLSWTARYWVVNFLILAFISLNFQEHLMIYARQLVMWVIMLISPTPGSAGVAEIAFSGFLKEFIPIGLAGTLALLWRLVSYYPYLFIGAIILPRWIKRTHS